MEVEDVGRRAHLFHLLQQHPDWTLQQYADAVGCSKSMVSTWRARFHQAQAQGQLDVSIFFARSRAPHHRPPRIDEAVKERIQQIRLDPPEGLKRTPGPVAILYYLQRDPELQAKGTRLPRSSRTVWRILDAAGLIERASERRRMPRQPLGPLEEIQLDFKDISTVPLDSHDPDAKRAHVIETCNFIDVGTSIVLDAQVHPTGCATSWHVAGKYRNFIKMHHTLLSQVAQHVFTQQQVSESVSFSVATRLRYFSFCSHQVRMLNEPAKGLEQHVPSRCASRGCMRISMPKPPSMPWSLSCGATGFPPC